MTTEIADTGAAKIQPWRAFWPLPEEIASKEVVDKPWLAWKPDPQNLHEKPWYQWMDDPRYEPAPDAFVTENVHEFSYIYRGTGEGG